MKLYPHQKLSILHMYVFKYVDYSKVCMHVHTYVRTCGFLIMLNKSICVCFCKVFVYWMMQ